MSKFKFEIGDVVIFRTCSSVRDNADYVDNHGKEVCCKIDNSENYDFVHCDGVWKIGKYAAKLNNNHIVVYHDLENNVIYEIFVRENAILPYNDLSKEYIEYSHNSDDEEYITNSYKKKVKNLLIQSSIDLDIDW